MTGFAIAAVAASLAVAQPTYDQAPYPKAHTQAEVASWLRAYTNVRPADVVVIGKDFLFAVDPGAQRIPSPASEVAVREEVLSPEVSARIRARSALMTMAVRCADRSFEMTSLAFYSGPNLTGHREVMSPSGAWVKAPAGDYVADVLSSLCDPGYRRPFAAMVASLPAPRQPYAPMTLAGGMPPPGVPARPLAMSAPAVARPRAMSLPAAGSTTYATGYLAQLGAFGSADAARAAFAALPDPERSQVGRRRIVPAPVRGVTLYRAQLTGFASAAAAEAFCRRARAQGSACLARPQQGARSR